MSKLTDSPHFRWMPGMLNTRGRRFAGMYDDYTAMYMNGCVPLTVHIKIWETAEPDTNDPATVGCLWQQLCEMAKARGWRQIMLTDDGKVLFHGHRDAPHAVRAFSDILGTIKLLSNVRHGLAAIEVAPEGDDA